ncbi:MAG: biotin--[acetyl-CoA-carboxylase] ligase [Euryarchaeota archaeon]|nr:biotin--[acetyl-CoA-carboxylase] ligase [Euryarchaeota archaeon]
MDISALKSKLRGSALWKDIEHRKEIGSTNEGIRALAEKGAPGGIVIVSDIQTGGKGRLGRKWESPKGGLWFSFLLRPRMLPGSAPVITLMAGAAVAKALRALYKIDARVKWPNDILIDGRKVCGILSEASAQGGKLDFAIVGIGINANNDARALRLERPIAQPVSVKDLVNREVDIPELLAGVLQAIEREYALVRDGKTDKVLSDWSSLSDTIGKRVEIMDAGARLMGMAKGIAADGALVLETESGDVIVNSGDCRYME